jgi:plasmid stabilization system protein ParE
MARLVWTDEAERWLRDIYDYIAADNPRAAAATIEGIYQRTQSLEAFPELGARHWASMRHVRVLLYGHYRIAYLVKDDGDVAILGVFHGALDISRYQL